MAQTNPGTVAGSLFDPELLARSPETFGGGGSKLPMFEEGMPYRNSGSPIAGNNADATDDILDGFQFPAGTFDAANRAVLCNFQGNFAAGAGNTKRIKVWLNPNYGTAPTVAASGQITGGTVSAAGSGVLLFDSTAVTGVAGLTGWQVMVDLCKTGASGSNTQNYQYAWINNTTHEGCSSLVAITQTEALPWQIVITGASGGSAANDVTLWGTSFNANN